MQDYDWQKIAPEVALKILGKPKVQKSNEWRYGNKGSLVFTLETGQFYDFEQGQGGGVKWLIEQHGQNVAEVLKQFGFDRPLQSINSSDFDSSPAVKSSSGRLFTREQMIDLYREAVIKMKYSEDFMVLRFGANHHIKQKYAPFSKNPNGSWNMCRPPSGLLPLYITNKSPNRPVLISEGEKACLASADLYKNGDVATWHGGVNSWSKTDWSPIFGRDVIIWPDNDNAGKEVASKISEYLKANGSKVKIAKIPENFAEKDDLWEALEYNYFKDDQEFDKYINECEEVKARGSLNFTKASDLLNQVTNPDWLIKDMLETSSLACVFGSPKSGKSFISIAMACAIAKGEDFYGNKATKRPVLYLVGEGTRAFSRRLHAINQGMYSLDGIPLYLSDRGVRINEQDDFDRLEEQIKQVEAIEGQIGLLVIDTFQRNFVGNENSAEDVGLFINKLDQIIADHNCCVCLVHHTGHGNSGRARGSSVLGASLDYEFKVERTDKLDDMYVNFKQSLNKDGQGMSEKNFIFKEVEIIGQGLDLTSGYLEETAVDFKAKNDITYKQKLVLEALEREGIFKDKENPQDHFFWPKDLQNKVSDKDGNVTSVESIKKLLYKLVETGYVLYFEDIGYQSMEYSKLAPKFD